MEEQILRYYLKIISLLFLVISITYFLNILYFKSVDLKKEKILIEKGVKLESIISNNFTPNNFINIFIYNNSIKLYDLLFAKIHFGEFSIDKETNLIKFLRIISKPSNIIRKITIIEGWSIYKLDLELQRKFLYFETINYLDVIADTYYIDYNEDFLKFRNKLYKNKDNFFKQHKKNNLLKKYSIDDLMIIGSLIEMEGKDYEDKLKISSVILNRLEKKMKLQIDATVIYAVTNGKYDLNRKLNYDDLKINHPYNTYKINGLPPKPISYVGRKTIEIIMENYITDYLFYYYDENIKKHVFSKNYQEHLKKLNDYRKK